jgi:predicted DCC family thiol-disulfide oxidoreductase YuxK
MTRARGADGPHSYRRDRAVPSFPDDRALFVFDGDCALCSGGARFVLRHDRRRRLQVAAAQSALGRSLYAHYGLDPERTNLLLLEGRAFTEAEAVLRVARLLGPPWSWSAVARLLPRPVRNAVYRTVAERRIRWFGRTQVCGIADPGDDRILG